MLSELTMAVVPGARPALVVLGTLWAGAACQPSPVNDPLYWDGRNTTGGGSRDAAAAEPEEGGAGGEAGRGAGGAGGALVLPKDAAVVVPAPPRDAALPVDLRIVDALPPAVPACKFEVTVTTVTTGVGYRPRNIGAIWIADGDGKFVKTLKLWADRRVQHLARWNQVTSAAALARNKLDAITGATISTHVVHAAAWDCNDARRMPVGNGMFQVCMEMTESNSAGGNPPTKQSCVPFMRGAEAAKVMPADEPNFKLRVLQYTPL